MKGICGGRADGCRATAIVLMLMAMVFAGACERADRGPTGLEPEPQAVIAEAAANARTGQGGQGAGQGAFFPLEIGNEWTYSRDLCLIQEMFVGGVNDSTYIHILKRHKLIGTEILAGQEYVVEEREERHIPGGEVSTSWIRYRQDRAGLYEADVSIKRPPAARGRAAGERVAAVPEGGGNPVRVTLWSRVSAGVDPEHRPALERAWSELTKKLDAIENIYGSAGGHSLVQGGPPGGVMPGEITRLAYPLRPGQEWTIRAEPFFGSEVEARDVLDLPPGKMSCAKINVTNFALGPDDEVFLWYGRDGFLRMTVHVETEMVDVGGNVVGVLIFDENTVLESVNLVGPGRF